MLSVTIVTNFRSVYWYKDDYSAPVYQNLNNRLKKEFKSNALLRSDDILVYMIDGSGFNKIARETIEELLSEEKVSKLILVTGESDERNKVLLDRSDVMISLRDVKGNKPLLERKANDMGIPVVPINPDEKKR